MVIGIISDTHGSLSNDALNALQGVDVIIHAGDVGGPDIIKALETVAPVKAVRGNTDGGPWASTLPLVDMLKFNTRFFYVLHDLHQLDLDPPAAGIDVVINGHTHQPSAKTVKGVLYFNPGSASHRRHGGPLSVGRINISESGLFPEMITLNS
jgi:putative phosphoesterase